MKAEEQIFFLAELLTLIRELQNMVSDYCQALTEEHDECTDDNTARQFDLPF